MSRRKEMKILFGQEYMNTKECADFIGCSTDTLKRYVKLTKKKRLNLPFTQLVQGGHLFFRKDLIEFWKETRTKQASE